MLISAYNILSYAVHRTWKSEFKALENIFSKAKVDHVLITPLLVQSPRNTLIRLSIESHVFLFKQPKFLTSGATWFIYKEFQFYKKFSQYNNSFLPSSFSFDKEYHILTLPFLKQISIPIIKTENPNAIIKEFAKQISTTVATFHSAMRIDERKKNAPYYFSRQSLSAFYSPYKTFFNSLKQGYKRQSFLDENVFNVLKNEKNLFIKETIYDFLWDDQIYNSLLDFSFDWYKNESYLIHGDLKIDNIFTENERVKLLDFELVSRGDNAWDIACILDSLLNHVNFLGWYDNNLNYRFVFFKLFINHYSNILKFDKNDKQFFLSRLLKFWAIKRIENLKYKIKNTDTDSKKMSILILELQLIRELLIDTKSLIKAFSTDDFSSIKNIFKYYMSPDS